MSIKRYYILCLVCITASVGAQNQYPDDPYNYYNMDTSGYQTPPTPSERFLEEWDLSDFSDDEQMLSIYDSLLDESTTPVMRITDTVPCGRVVDDGLWIHVRDIVDVAYSCRDYVGYNDKKPYGVYVMVTLDKVEMFPEIATVELSTRTNGYMANWHAKTIAQIHHGTFPDTNTADCAFYVDDLLFLVYNAGLTDEEFGLFFEKDTGCCITLHLLQYEFYKWFIGHEPSCTDDWGSWKIGYFLPSKLKENE